MMYSSRNLNDSKEFLEVGSRQSNVPHFDVLEDADWTGSVCSENGPKQTNASAYLSGKGTLSRSQRDVDRCSTGSLRRSRVEKKDVSSQNHYSQIQSDGRDVLDAVFEDPQRKLTDSERNISEEEDQWLSHQGRTHPSSKANLRHGITHCHEQSRLSTEGSFHLSHLEGDYVSEGSDEMEYSSGSDYLPPVQGTGEAYIHQSLSSNSYHDCQPRSERTYGSSLRNSSSFSKHDGLSWQQYKALATRRKEAQNHTGMMDIEEINVRSYSFSENESRTSTCINQNEPEVHQEPDILQRRVLLDMSTEQRSPSELSDATLNTFQSQGDQRRIITMRGRNVRTSTLVDDHHKFNPRANNYDIDEFEREYLDDGTHQMPHPFGTNRFHPSPFYNQSEEGDDTLDLDEFALPGAKSDRNTSKNGTTSKNSISEFIRISPRTNVERSQGACQVADSIITRTNSSDSKLEPSEQRTLSAESQLKSVLPAVLEQNHSGARLLKQSLPPASYSASDRTVSGNSSSLGQKRPRRRKLETEFLKTQTATREASVRTRQYAERVAQPLGLSGRTDLEPKSDSIRDGAMPNTVLSSISSSDWMARSVQEDQRISSRQLQDTGYSFMHQQGGHYSQNTNNLSKTESKAELNETPEPSGSIRSNYVLQSDTFLGHPHRTVSDILKVSRPTSSTNPAFPDGFDPVQDLLISSSILSASKAKTTSAKATSQSLITQEPNDVRTSKNDLLTTSKGSASQYSSALSSFSVQSPEVFDQLPLQTSSALEGHLTQHYPYTGLSSSNQQSEGHESVTSSLHQSSGRSVHSTHSELDHPSSIETAADGHQPESSKRDWYPKSGFPLASSQHGDLQDFHSNRDHQSVLFQGRRPELQRAMNYHLDEETHQYLSQGTLSHSNKMQRCYANRASSMNSEMLTEMGFSTGGSPRRVTSILWVFKLLDILHNQPVEKHELLVSQAYWFRRWLSKVRLLKMIRQEERDKWRKAIAYHDITVQQKCLRQWTASVQSRSKSARLLYQHRLLHKGLSAFRFAVMSSKVQEIQLKTRLKVMTLAKYFSKWSTLTQLRKEKEAILDRIANQHVTVKAFSVWKEGYHTQQRLGIADLHYKVGLLSKSIDNWKVYVVQRRKKFLETEVARVFHEERLMKRAWVTVVTIYAERQKARRQFRRSMLCRSWRAWRHGLQIIKMENLHDNAKAMVFRDQAALQSFFADWKERAKVSVMKHRSEKTQLGQAFELWKLKNRRRQMLGRILDSKARKSLRKKTFSAWREHTKQSIEARQEGVRLIERVQMGVVITAWQTWTRKRLCQRQDLQEHLAVRNAGLVHSSFHQWKLCWLREKAVHQGLKRWTEECLKKAVHRWKQLVVERRREDKAEEFLRRSEKVFLRRSFSEWTEAKTRAECEWQRAADMQDLLTRSQLHRTFLAWKLEMMETRAVAPLTERKEKRCLAKAFDGWRDIITRKKTGLSFADRCKNSITARTFRFWRDRTKSHIRTKQEQDSLETSLVQGCFQAWQRLHQRETTRRVVTKQRETGCLRDAFSSWRAQTEEAELERDTRTGNEQRRLLLQKVFFKAWRRVSGEEVAMENERCSVIQAKLAASTILEMWKRWRRSLELELRERSLIERNNRRRLEEAFRSWHRYTQQSIDAAINRFHERLNESSSSLQSPSLLATFPPALSSSSSSSPSSPGSPSSSQLQTHWTPSPYASFPSPLRELSMQLVDESYAEFSYSVTEERVVQPSGPSPGSVEDIVTGVTSCGEDSPTDAVPDRIITTPSPLRNLPVPLSNSSGDQEDADFIHPKPFEVKGQLESGEGSVISLDQGVESSSQSVDSQPSYFGVSSVTDSGYHANGFTMFSNGGSQLEASSDSASLRSAKDYGNTIDALRKSPHKNNNNSVSQLMELSQRPEEWAGLTKLWFSSEEPPGDIEGDYPLLDEMASPESVVQNGHQALPVANGSGSSPSWSAMSTVIDFQVEHSYAMQSRCTNGSRNTNDWYMTGNDQSLINYPVEADLKIEEDDDDDDENGDDESISNESLGAESLLLTPEKSAAHFRNLQTSTNITDKKAYLTSVILRLQLWPASAAFYQWLEYTRMKKLHRHYKALVESRMNDADLRALFLHWRQRSSESQLATNYLNKRLLERYFRTWSSTKERGSQQEIQLALAERHASHTLLQSAWTTWKEQFLQSLYPIGPRPSWSTHFSQSQLMSQRCASFQANIQGRNVRECLVFWRLRWRQLREADHYRTRVILTRCLLSWSSWSRENRWRQKAARNMLAARRKRMAFQHWRTQLAKLKLIHTHYHGAAHSHLCLIIRAWHRWAETNKRLRLSQEVVKQRCHALLLSQAWLLWKREVRKNRRAQARNHGKIIQRTFSGWKSVIHEVKQYRLILNSIQSRKQHTTLSTCFTHWKMEYNGRRFAEVQKDRQARRTMAEVLAVWKMFVAERRCERQKQKEVLQEAFSIWQNQYLNMKRRKQLALSAATHWRHVVRRSRELTETMNLFRCSVEERNCKQAFLWWQRSWISHQLADRHHSNRLLNRAQHCHTCYGDGAFSVCTPKLWNNLPIIIHDVSTADTFKKRLKSYISMQGLKELVKLSRRLCVVKQYIVSKREKSLLELYFRKWKDRQSHMTDLYVASAKVTGELADRSLAVAFLMWRLRYRERQTEHSYKHKLILKVWQTWRESQANHQKAESMRAEKEKGLLRQSFNALRNWARDHSGRRIVLQCVRSRKNHFTLKMTFAVWRDESRLRQLARDHHNMCIQREVLISWSSFSQKQKVLTSLHQMVTSRVNKRSQNIAFRAWKEAYIATQEAEAKLKAFLEKKETSLLARCIINWRGEVLEAQVRRLRERRMMRWGVVRWRRSMEKRRLIRQYERDLEELAALHWEQTVRRGHFDKWRLTLEAMRRQRRHCFLEQKYGFIWKRHVGQMIMAQAMARYLRLERCWKAWRRRFIMDQVSRETLAKDQRVFLTKVFNKWHQLAIQERTEQAS